MGIIRKLAFAAMALCALPALAGCASATYAGISLEPGAAAPDLQQLARRASDGDKRAQLELGIRYEEGRGVAVDRDRSERLYRAAATQTGGTRIAHIPGRNGRSSAVPINSGRLYPGLPEAAARLAALQERTPQAPLNAQTPVQQDPPPASTSMAPADRGFYFQDDGSPGTLSGPVAEAFSTLLRIEINSDRCFGDEGQSARIEQYADAAWRCIMASNLPEDCRQYADAVVRTVRFIRLNPSFTLLNRSAVGVIERCVPARQRSLDEIYDSRARANFLDMVMLHSGHASNAQKLKVDVFLRSFETHSARHPPILRFGEAVCRLIQSGVAVEPLSFWLLFCNSGNPDFNDRAERASAIDIALAERGIHGSAN